VPPLEALGWRLLFHPDFFGAQYDALIAEAERLRSSLPETRFKEHPTTKLVYALGRLVHDIVPANPNHPDFLLRGDLSKFRRVKGHGLPERFRLFFVFSSTARAIVYLYLNDTRSLRQQGARGDPYVIFQQLVRRHEIGDDFQTNLARWLAARRADSV
jgi:toxin YhaV